MSFVVAGPAAVAAAAANLAGIGTNIGSANAAAAAPTTESLAPSADQVSNVVAGVFSNHAQEYQNFSAQMAAFHEHLVQALNAGAQAYAEAEALNAQHTGINAPVQSLLGGP